MSKPARTVAAQRPRRNRVSAVATETGGFESKGRFAEARDLWDVMEPEGHEYRDLGDRVLVVGRCRVRGRVSGAESHPACAWVIGVRDGTIVSHRTCATFDEAVQVAGVEPAKDHTS